MIDIESFHFLRPQWFMALIPLLLVSSLLAFRKISNRSWEAICDRGLLPFILISGAGRRRHVSTVLITLAGLTGIIALAGPVWEKLPQPVFTTQNALVIGLDLTRSMDADDISPSRLARSRFKIRDILEQRSEGQTALLVYGGDAFTVTPLTDDRDTISSQLNALNTGIMPAPGNRTAIAINQSVALLKQAGMSRGDVLLITDEVNLNESENAARQLRRQGYRLSILGVGTEHGVPVPLADGSFLKGNKGEIVIPVLDDGPLQELASAGGGVYVQLSKDDQDIQRLTGYFSTQGNRGEEIATELETDTWREQGPWLVLCLLPLAALLFRRGYVFLLLVLVLPPAGPVYAFDWDSLWLRKDQQGQRAMEAEDYEKAAQLFNDPAWRAAAQHRSKNYQAAVETLNRFDDAESHYNKGNALARMGNYQEAIAAYDRTLALSPEHDDAKFNRELLEKEMEQQQNQQQSEQGQQQQEQQSEQQQAEQNQQQSEQQSGRQQSEQDQQQGSERQQSEQNQPQQDQQSRQAEQDQNQEAQQENNQQQAEQTPQQQQERLPGQLPEQQQLAQTEESNIDEEQQATEQWLRRIPDDPSGLLRRKFRYQYQQRHYETNQSEKSW